MPYLGYWQLMAAVDKYVVYDDVNYIKGGWVARNNILMNGKPYMFTIMLKGASPNKHFNEIEIGDDFHKFRRMLANCYGKAPFYKETMEIMESIFTYPHKDLGRFMLNSFQVVLDYLSVDTELILSSSIDKDNTLKGKEKVLQICRLLKADTYYNAIGGQDLYDIDEFRKNGIELKFLKTHFTPYQQYKNAFVEGLSMIDVLMFNSKEQVLQLLNDYTLV